VRKSQKMKIFKIYPNMTFYSLKLHCLDNELP
jgi:hypothetical protein